MANNVVRKDVIEIGFKTDMGSLNKLTSGMDKLKASVNSLGNDSGLKKTQKDIDNLKQSVGNVRKSGAQEFKNVLSNIGKTSFVKVSNSLSEVGRKLSEIASKAGKSAYNALKKIAGVSFKALAAGVGASAIAVGAVVKSAVSAYGENQQQVGGIETLFGAGGAKSVEEYAQSMGKSVAQVQDKYNALKASESKALEYAKQAYKTAGLSANKYMETSTSFAASLLQSVGGDTMQAAEKANTAIIDMSDNANKMGTSMEAIQNAYQGFAKQNWTMLDNLKLGYGGTKEEMERLLSDAGKIAGKSFSKENLSDVFEAIHIIQTQLGITGTTAKEAEGTITGSMSMVKASWQNMLVALVKGDGDFGESLTNLIGSVKIFGKNIIPAVQGALKGVGSMIKELAPIISAEIPALMESVVPNLLSAATEIANGLISALPTILSSAISVLPSLADKLLNSFISLVMSLTNDLRDVLQNSGPQIITTLMNTFKEAITRLSGLIPQLTTFVVQLISSLLQQLPTFIDAGINLIQGLVQGIVASIPSILEQAPKIIESFTTALINGLPALINGSIAIINTLVQGLIYNMPKIISAAQTLITKLCEGLIANLPIVVRSAIQLILALTNALINNIGMLITAAIQLIVGLQQGIISNLGIIIQAAVEIIIALVAGLIQAIPTLLSAVPKVFGALKNAIISINWIDVGKTIISGIWNGIKGAGKGLLEGVKGLFGGDKNTIKVNAGGNVKNPFAKGITKGVGYANGGIATKPSIFGEDGAEVAIPLSSDKRNKAVSLWNQTGNMLGVRLASYSPENDSKNYVGSTTVENNTYAPEFNLTISGTNDDRTMARKVKQWISEALDETFDSLYRQNKRIQEI